MPERAETLPEIKDTLLACPLSARCLPVLRRFFPNLCGILQSVCTGKEIVFSLAFPLQTTALNLAAVRLSSRILPPQYSAAVRGKVPHGAHKRDGDG